MAYGLKASSCHPLKKITMLTTSYMKLKKSIIFIRHSDLIERILPLSLQQTSIACDKFEGYWCSYELWYFRKRSIFFPL